MATWCEELTHWKRPWCWEGLGAGGEGDDRGWDGWMASPTWWAWVWVNPGVGDGEGGLACYDSRGHKESDTTELLNWTELIILVSEGCHNKVKQMRYLKTTEMYSFPDLEARNLQSKGWQFPALPEVLKVVLTWLLMVANSTWYS